MMQLITFFLAAVLLAPLPLLRAADQPNAFHVDGSDASSVRADGTRVKLPKKADFHLFMLLGQSNMVGRGEMTRLPPHPRLLTFDKMFRWKEAVDPLHETGPRDRVGPGVSFGRGLLQVIDENVSIGLIPCALGGSPLERWQKGGDLYAAALHRARAAMNHGSLRGVLWLHGEKDATNIKWSETYAQRLDQMIADLRADLGSPHLPFVAALPCQEIMRREDRPGASMVMQSLRSLPDRVSYTACADSAGLRSTGDKVHFVSRHLRELGRRFAVSMASLLGYREAEITPGYPWYAYHPSFDPPTAEPGLPNVLLIGDSISMFYTAEVRQHLSGVANVFRPPANCRTTRQTLRYLDAYLGQRKWDVIHFNWGIHDLTHVNSVGRPAPPPHGKHQVPLDEYERNLASLLDRLKITGARLIWATTTPIGKHLDAQGVRRDQDVVAYNAAAADVMKAERITMNDLYALAKPRAEELLSDGVHFNGRGREELAQAVAESIRSELTGEATHRQVTDSSESLSPLARKLLGASQQQLEMFAKAREKGLIELAPVNLPIDPPGDCNHYGWPIATVVDEAIVVMHRRIPGHNPHGAGEPHEKMSYGIVLRSEDGGKTWSKPYDLRDCMKPDDRNRGGIVPLSHRAKFDKGNKSPQGYKVHLHSIGTTQDGGVIAINNHGVFRSDDAGRNWKHFSNALRDDTFPHEIVNLGPRILDHSQHGLLIFGNWFGEVDVYHKLSNQFVALSSRDGGATWRVEEHPAGFPQYEPAVLYYDEKFLFVTRDQTKVRAHRQMTWLPGMQPEIVSTNLKNPRYIDTVDFNFNPVTQRFEIVRSERYRMELWIWSMDPSDWESGHWRRECRLLARTGEFWRDADGFHPASAIIDTKRGVQHIFIYAGHSNGPAGVFRITRTLDTPKLAALLKPNE